MAITRSQINALIKRYEVPIRKAFLAAIANAKTRAQFNLLVAAIEQNNIDAILSASGVREGMYSAFTESIRTVYGEHGALVIAKDLPKKFALQFDINNPRAEAWLRQNSLKVISEDLMPKQRTAIQKVLEAGLQQGKNPRATALDIVGRIGPTGRRTGGAIGLSDPHVTASLNMRKDLDQLNWSSYQNRKLRDKRFDSVVKKAAREGTPLPQATQDKIVGRYEDRLLKHRGDTIARTETLKALNSAADEALLQVIDDGSVPRHAAKRVWRHSWSPNEREGHVLLSGEERGVDEYFVNPITGARMKHPHDGPPGETINCRCWLEHKIDFAAVELARLAA